MLLSSTLSNDCDVVNAISLPSIRDNGFYNETRDSTAAFKQTELKARGEVGMSQSGGLLQLVSTGRQDIYLSGNPQMTFFKQVYRRHTNFSIETRRIPFETAVEFGKLTTATIPRSGDLLSQLLLEIRLPMLTPQGPAQSSGCSGVATIEPYDYQNVETSYSWVNGAGHAMIEYVSIMIGQQEVDRQYGEWMHIWTQLSTPGSKVNGVYNMIGQQEVYNETTQIGPLRLFVPLRFWFCNNIGLSLPLVALQSAPIRVYVKLRNGMDMVFSSALETDPCLNLRNPPTVSDMVLWGDFVYLDTAERRRFAASKHEYLIEQVQTVKRYSIPEKTVNISVPLSFNHPIKEIIWVVQQDRMIVGHEWFNYGSRMLNEYGVLNTDLINSCVLQLDGYDRFERQSSQYFRLVQPWQRHTAIPNDFIYVYSFSLAPEASQPQGTCNASRLDSMVLQLEMNGSVPTRACGVTVYATNYNVLRVVAGLGGLLFTI
jgi:hypothetical protein